jgi:hypothetical protein
MSERTSKQLPVRGVRLSADAPFHPRLGDLALDLALGVWALGMLAEVATQYVSELVVNAVRYSGARTLRVTASRPGKHWVRIAVGRRRNAPLARVEPGPAAEHGWGMVLVNALSDRCGTDIRRAAERFRCEFDVTAGSTCATTTRLAHPVTAQAGHGSDEVRR